MWNGMYLVSLWCYINIAMFVWASRPYSIATLTQPIAWVWGGAICLLSQWQKARVFKNVWKRSFLQFCLLLQTLYTPPLMKQTDISQRFFRIGTFTGLCIFKTPPARSCPLSEMFLAVNQTLPDVFIPNCWYPAWRSSRIYNITVIFQKAHKSSSCSPPVWIAVLLFIHSDIPVRL